ncbi:MAG: hypothetical protein OEZ06_06675 [Myxococcales bacterium]|nr:hypothetical protein [Myxococcales bacterium]
MANSRALQLLPLLSLVTTAACDDEPPRPRYQVQLASTSVSADAPLASVRVSGLQDPDLEQVCQSFDSYVETYVSFDAIAYIACLPAAIVLGGSEEGCERQLEECMGLFPEPIAVQAATGPVEVCVDRLRGCDATVAEFEGCANVNLDLAVDIAENWSCRGLDGDRIAEAARAMDTVSVCADVDAVCAEASRVVGPE